MKPLKVLTVVMAVASMMVTDAEGERLHFNTASGYSRFSHGSPDGIIFRSISTTDVPDTLLLDKACHGFRLTFRLSDLNSHPYGKYEYTNAEGELHKAHAPGWSLIAGSGEENIRFNFRRIQKEESLSSRDAMLVTVVASGKDTVGSKVIDKGMNMFDGVNAYRLTLDDGVMTLACGDREYGQVISFNSPIADISYLGFRPGDGGYIRVTDINFISDGNELPALAEELTETEIKDILSKSPGGLAGYWMEYDRSFDESTLRMGGNYLLAVIPEGEGYEIRYLSGAKKNPGMWNPGMLKGRLTPTPFGGVYEVEWIDAAGLPLSNNVRAQSDGEILTVSFPYHSSTLRLRRVTSF